MNKLLCFCLSLLLLNCTSTGKKNLARGNYYQSVIESTEKLRRSSDNKTASKVLKQALPLALKQSLQQIDQLNKSAEQFKYDGIVRAYQNLNNLADEIYRCPNCQKYVDVPATYKPELQAARSKAADEHVVYANEKMTNKNDRNEAKLAFENYELAKDFLNDYPKINQKLDEALFYATLKVVVEQAQISSKMYQYSNEFFQNKILEYISNNRRMNKYVRFLTPIEARTENLKYPDHVIELNFEDFVVGQTYLKSDTETITSQDSVVVGEVSVGGKKLPVKNKVSAKVTTNHKIVESKGLLALRITDRQTNRILFDERVEGVYSWTSNWASFNGDERALTTNMKSLVNSREGQVPAPQILFVEFCKPIYDQVTYKIRRFYEKY
jgi:hypothetical protein